MIISLEVKRIQRDSLLLLICFIPIMIALVIRFLLPVLADFLQTRFAFDLTPLYPLIMSLFLMMASGAIGMVTGLNLLDERDERTLLAMAVTPVSLQTYILIRVGLAMMLGLILTVIGYPLAGLSPLPLGWVVLIAAFGSFAAPFMALLLAVVAENKVTGFAMIKLLNTLMMIPIAMYFVESGWQILAGIIPTYWILKVYWLLSDGAGFGMVAPYLLMGLLVNVAWVGYLLRRLNRMVI